MPAAALVLYIYNTETRAKFLFDLGLKRPRISRHTEKALDIQAPTKELGYPGT
jgi:hypothetical protein